MLDMSEYPYTSYILDNWKHTIKSVASAYNKNKQN